MGNTLGTAVLWILADLKSALAWVLAWPVGSRWSRAVEDVCAWSRADTLRWVLAFPDSTWWWWALGLICAGLWFARAVCAWVGNWSGAVFGISANLRITVAWVFEAGSRPEASWWGRAGLGVFAWPVNV